MGAVEACVDVDDEKKDTDLPVKFKNYDPNLLIEALCGTWSGDQGKDNLFVRDPSKQQTADSFKDGFVTTYKETYEFLPLAKGILNPKTNSKLNPRGDETEGEILYGLRYYQKVISTVDHEKSPNNPFKAGSVIHEETGFLLFCYIGQRTDNTEVVQTLKRIVRTSAIPRAISILSHCEAKDITDTLSVKEGGGIIEFVLYADSKATAVDQVEWVVANGSFPDRNGKIESYKQTCKFNINFKDPSNSWFKYLQITPLKFEGKSTFHNNENTLYKVASASELKW